MIRGVFMVICLCLLNKWLQQLIGDVTNKGSKSSEVHLKTRNFAILLMKNEENWREKSFFHTPIWDAKWLTIRKQKTIETH